MKKHLILLISVYSVAGCSPTQNATYTITDNISIKTIGLAKLDASSKLLKNNPGINTIVSAELKKEFEKQGIVSAYPLSLTTSFATPDAEEIKTVCSSNNLDGIVATKMGNPNIKDTLLNGKSVKKIEMLAWMKLIDRNGKTMLTVSTKNEIIQDDDANQLVAIVRKTLENPVQSVVDKMQH